MLNSAIMSVGGVIVVLVASTTAGYAFARLEFPGREKLFAVYVATLLIPANATVVPLFRCPSRCTFTTPTSDSSSLSPSPHSAPS